MSIHFTDQTTLHAKRGGGGVVSGKSSWGYSWGICDGGLKVAKCGKRTSSFSSSTECTVTTLHAEDVGYSTSSTERAGGAGVPGASMRAAGRRRSKRDV